MKKLIIATAALALVAAPALAQKRGAPRQQTPEEMDQKRQSEALDQQYKATLKRMNKDGATARTDPWSNMRETSDATKK
jgi:hypothetical protein